jgi:folylpolyglutamate synthase
VSTVHANERRSLFDATNVFDSPAITAITKLGMDHVHLLGPSLAEIARNKAGIMRMEHSNRLSAPLDDVTEDDPPSKAIAALPTVAHRTNAALALKVVTHLLLQRYSPDQNLRVLDEQDVVLGLQQYKSPGSFREIARPPCHFFLDTAHNTLSLPVALEWYAEKVALNEQE